MTRALPFARGFVFSRANDPAATSVGERLAQCGWRTIRNGLGSFLVHPDLNLTVRSSGLHHVVLLGLLIDPQSNRQVEPFLDDVLERLAGGRPIADLFVGVTGRFVCFTGDGDSGHVLRDAAGLQALYVHSGDDLILSSHAQLIADLCSLPQNMEARALIKARRRGTSAYLPGDESPISQVRMLPANQRLCLSTGTVTRIFPTQNYATISMQEAIDVAASILTNTASLIAERHQLSLSLTSGVDSRLSAAAFHAHRPLYFTYANVRGLQFGSQIADAIRARQIARRLGGKLKLILAGRSDPSFLAQWHHNSAYVRSGEYANTAYALYESLPHDRLHIKSNVSEIFRCYWQRRGHSISAALPKSLSLAYGNSSHYVVQIHSQFCARYSFSRESLRGYDPLDMFYWEHKMAAWQSLQLMDFDPCFASFIPFSNQALLDTLLRVPVEHRISDELPKRLTARLAPQLLNIPYGGNRMISRAINKAWLELRITNV